MQMQDFECTRLQVTLKKRGKPTTSTTIPTWACSDPTLLSLTPNDDGSMLASALGQPGKCQVTAAFAFAKPVTSTLDVEIVSSDPDSADITNDQPVPIG